MRAFLQQVENVVPLFLVAGPVKIPSLIAVEIDVADAQPSFERKGYGGPILAFSNTASILACVFATAGFMSCVPRNAEVCGEAQSPDADVSVEPGCESIPQTGSQAPSGLVSCPGEQLHRVEQRACVGCVDVRLCPQIGGCADCPPPHLCAEGSGGSCFCYLPCTTDADCATGEACVCPSGTASGEITTGNIFPQCVVAACLVDQDCDSRLCALSRDVCGAPLRLDCMKAEGGCTSDAECQGGRCSFNVDQSSFQCETIAECE
jgi:hypothetical protein